MFERVGGFVGRGVPRSGHGVEVVALSSSGQTGVAKLGVEAVGAEEECLVAGHALCFVDGGCVPLGEKTIGDVIVRHSHSSAFVECYVHVAIVGVSNGTRVAVHDAEVVPVAVSDDSVVASEFCSTDLGDGLAYGFACPGIRSGRGATAKGIWGSRIERLDGE